MRIKMSLNMPVKIDQHLAHTKCSINASYLYYYHSTHYFPTQTLCFIPKFIWLSVCIFPNFFASPAQLTKSSAFLNTTFCLLYQPLPTSRSPQFLNNQDTLCPYYSFWFLLVSCFSLLCNSNKTYSLMWSIPSTGSCSEKHIPTT